MANKLATTSNSGRFRDPMPHIRAAGKVLTDPDDCVETCLKPANIDRPKTPPHMQPFRRTFREQPGQAAVHFGKAFDPNPPDIRFGQKNDYSTTAEHLIRPPQTSSFTDKRRSLKESVYHSCRTEPLGRTPLPVAPLPAICQDPKFKFGKPTNTSESSKNLIYPVNDPYDEDAEAHRLYCKTHAGYYPGEQRTREYDWAAHGIDPTSFRFGKLFGDKDETGQSAVAALKPDMMKAYGTVIVKKAVEDYRDIAKDELGQVRNLGFGERNLPPDFVFGRSTKSDEYDAKKLIAGLYTPEQLQPDKDLGRPVKHAKYPLPNEDTVFGAPTIRTDLKRPKNRSMCDPNNYGDEPTAMGVMYPSKYSSLNVNEEDFLNSVSKPTMKEMAQKAGFGLNDANFDLVWNQASTYSKDGSVCVEAFRRAADELGF